MSFKKLKETHHIQPFSHIDFMGLAQFVSVIFYNKISNKINCLMTQESFHPKLASQSEYFKSNFSEKSQYTYFDSSTRIYFQRKRKYDLQNQQNRLDKQRKQLAACTFRPVLASQRYYTKSNTNMSIRQNINFQKGSFWKKQEKPYQRLIKWGKKKQDFRRSKIIEQQIRLITLTRSLSREKSSSKLNKSLQQTLRSEDDSVLRSITTSTVPLPSAQQIVNPQSSYSTFQEAKRKA